MVKSHAGTAEFVALMALLISIEALSIDAMLPALAEIGQSLGAEGNQPQFVIGSLFLGVAIGQFFSGPLSDGLGRRPVLFGFIALFLIGAGICAVSANFTQMLAGRVLQGFGAAGPLIVAIAIVRDRYKGREMARIISFVMAVFILAPVIAPLIGQGILLFAGWRAIFGMLAILAALALIWFALRQPETLPPGARTAVGLKSYLTAAQSALGARPLVVYTGVQGLIFGAFVGYLSSARQIFQDIYAQGTLFPVFFALLSLSIGAAAVANGSLVLRLGMRRLTAMAFMALIVLSALFYLWSQLHDGQPPFISLLGFLAAMIFCVGVAFGNLSAMALEPLGEQAGMGATLFGGVSTLIALGIGALIGQGFDGTIEPVILGFTVASAAAFALMWADGGSPWRAGRNRTV